MGRAAILAGLVVLMSGACAEAREHYTGPPIPLTRLDLDRMLGRWYLVATVRQKGFEQGMVAPYDVYSKVRDGVLQDDFYVRRNSFAAPPKHYTLQAWIKPGTNNAHWRVQLFWPVKLPFLAVYVDPQYRYVIFGEDDRGPGWIYSRTQTVPEADYSQLMGRLEALGYDPARFVKFVQLPEQIGKSGFWSDEIH